MNPIQKTVIPKLCPRSRKIEKGVKKMTLILKTATRVQRDTESLPIKFITQLKKMNYPKVRF